jgi:hypothetical protein
VIDSISEDPEHTLARLESRAKRESTKRACRWIVGGPMISDDLQFRLTKAQPQRLEEALASLRASAGAEPTKLPRLEIDVVRAQVEDLRAEIRAYEELGVGHSGGRPT